MTSFNVAVVFMIFNRPEAARGTLRAISAIRPTRLLVIADGPRPGHPTDAARCKETREVLKEIDWPCDVETNFSDSNLGTRRRFVSGLDWAFSRAEEVVILEDDCVPDPSFFPFCQEMLERYRDDNRVMAVCGRTSAAGQKRNSDYSYYFSTLYTSWGWASWRRAWEKFDVEMKEWPAVRRQGYLKDLFNDRGAARFWTTTLNLVHSNDLNSFSYRFQFSCWLNNALIIKPTCHLVRNIGIGAEATMTKDMIGDVNKLMGSMQFPLRHFPHMVPDRLSDLDNLRRGYYRPFYKRAYLKLRHIARSLRRNNGESGTSRLPQIGSGAVRR